MSLIYTEEFYKLEDYMKKGLTHSKQRRRMMQRLWKSKTFKLEPKPVVKPQYLEDVERSVDETQHYQYIRIHTEGLRNGSNFENSLDRKVYGYIDVGDGCWRRNVSVTTSRCW